MKLSSTTCRLSKFFGDRKAVDILCEAGFDAVDYSFATGNFEPGKAGKEYFTDLRAYAEQKGMVFNQAHAPCPSSTVDEAETDAIYKTIAEAIKNASYLGVPNIIVHPYYHLDYQVDDNAERLFEMNMKFYKSLIPYSEEYGVRIALENMWQWKGNSTKFENFVEASACGRPDEMIRYYDSLGNDCFTVCLDIGHALLVRENPDVFIRKLGKERLTCLHVHDAYADLDWHTLPYFGEVNWDRTMKALADIGYSGDFTFEVAGFHDNLPTELWQDAFRFMAATGRYLMNKINL